MSHFFTRKHPCPECGGNVGWHAPACPHCGHPLMFSDRIAWLSDSGQSGFILGVAAFVGLTWSFVLDWAQRL